MLTMLPGLVFAASFTKTLEWLAPHTQMDSLSSLLQPYRGKYGKVSTAQLVDPAQYFRDKQTIMDIVQEYYMIHLRPQIEQGNRDVFGGDASFFQPPPEKLSPPFLNEYARMLLWDSFEFEAFMDKDSLPQSWDHFPNGWILLKNYEANSESGDALDAGRLRSDSDPVPEPGIKILNSSFAKMKEFLAVVLPTKTSDILPLDASSTMGDLRKRSLFQGILPLLFLENQKTFTTADVHELDFMGHHPGHVEIELQEMFTSGRYNHFTRTLVESQNVSEIVDNVKGFADQLGLSLEEFVTIYFGFGSPEKTLGPERAFLYEAMVRQHYTQYTVGIVDFFPNVISTRDFVGLWKNCNQARQKDLQILARKIFFRFHSLSLRQKETLRKAFESLNKKNKPISEKAWISAIQGIEKRMESSSGGVWLGGLLRIFSRSS